jgi:hypothetical protein
MLPASGAAGLPLSPQATSVKTHTAKITIIDAWRIYPPASDGVPNDDDQPRMR